MTNDQVASRQLIAMFPVDEDTPPDMLELLAKLDAKTAEDDGYMEALREACEDPREFEE